MSAFSFPRDHRLRKRYEFVSLGKQGRRVKNAFFIAVFAPSQKTRLGITVTKKVGNAVVRNRIKRYVREFFRLNQNRLNVAYDINIIAKKDCERADSAKIFAALDNLFNKISEGSRH